MNNAQFNYWHKQTLEKPLFTDIAWNKPEQRSRAGRMAILGGNKLGFAAIAENYSEALKIGAGECRVILPDVLKKSIPTTITDTVFIPSNPSGGISKEGGADLFAAAEWANMLLLIGDSGKNSETAMAYENLLQKTDSPVVIARDVIDLLRQNSNEIIARENTLLVLSFAQLQKLFQAVYYPKLLTFSMQITSLVEALHKFTITYPANIMVMHNDNLLVASGGEVSSTPWNNPMAIWRGSVATKAACYWLWNPKNPFEAITASIIAE